MNQAISETKIQTNGQGFIDITKNINEWIHSIGIIKGIIVISLQHTSCSLIINENADPLVLKDLSSFMKALVPEEGFKAISGLGASKSYQHSSEGLDDMPAHIRTTLTATCLTLSINSSKLILGIWQAIYLWEHRKDHHERRLILHAVGEFKKTK